jgi:RecB family exonuclease
MTESKREAFLSGDRPDDVAFFLHESAVSGIEALADRGERTDEGVVIVVDGNTGRSAFESATGIDPMALAKSAMGTEGAVDRDLTGGDCPDGDDHDARLVFAFAEEQNEDVEGLYTEGDVIHAYVACECGTRYSEKWLAGE